MSWALDPGEIVPVSSLTSSKVTVCGACPALTTLRLAPGASLDDGWLHVVVIEDIGTFEVLRLLPRLTGSGELRTSRVKRWRARKVRLAARTPSLFHGDGEILGTTPLEIEVVPRAVQVLAPAPR